MNSLTLAGIAATEIPTSHRLAGLGPTSIALRRANRRWMNLDGQPGSVPILDVVIIELTLGGRRKECLINAFRHSMVIVSSRLSEPDRQCAIVPLDARDGRRIDVRQSITPLRDAVKDYASESSLPIIITPQKNAPAPTGAFPFPALTPGLYPQAPSFSRSISLPVS